MSRYASFPEIRTIELLLLSIVVLSQVVFWSLGAFVSSSSDNAITSLVGGVLLSLFFAAPIVLAFVSLVHLLFADIGVGSILLVPVSLVTIYVVGISALVLIFPPEGGGVYGGHMFTSLTMIVFVPAVLFQVQLNRLFSQFLILRGGLLRYVSGD